MSGFGNRDVSPPSKAVLEEDLRENPGVPFVFPADLPDGYRFVARTLHIRSNGYTTARGLVFASTPPGPGVVVNLCIERRLPGSHICLTAKRDKVGESTFHRRLDGLVVHISLSGAASSGWRAWRTVRLTSDLDTVTWIENA